MNEDRKLKILLVQTQAENAGAQEISRLVAEGLVERGHDVRQLFFFRRTKAFDNDTNVILLHAERPTSLFGVIGMLKRLFRTFRQERPDVVISFQHYGNIIAAPIARLAGIPVVIANQVSAAATVSAPVRYADRLLGQIGAYSSIIVNSNETAAFFRKYPRSYRRRIVRIDHGFADKSVDMSSQAARESFGLPLKVPLLGCASRLHPLKSLDHAIRVLPVNNDQHLALAGQGEDEQRLRALAKQLGVENRVHFLGELSPQEIGVFFAALDCFVFPSSAETFGLAPVEAAQAGLPVVANGLPILRDVLQVDGEACAIFVETSDAAGFANAINSLLENRDIMQKLRDNGKKLARRYPLEAMLDAYANLTESLTLAKQN